MGACHKYIAVPHKEKKISTGEHPNQNSKQTSIQANKQTQTGDDTDTNNPCGVSVYVRIEDQARRDTGLYQCYEDKSVFLAGHKYPVTAVTFYTDPDDVNLAFYLFIFFFWKYCY